MKHLNRGICLTLLAISFSAPSLLRAASEDECAIWLCLPVGFLPSDCDGPRKAMSKRILKMKSPLPAFSSCSVDGESHGMEIESMPFGYFFLTGEMNMAKICFGPFSEPGCIAYVRDGVMQDGELQGEYHYRPIEDESGYPSFTQSEWDAVQKCRTAGSEALRSECFEQETGRVL